MSRGLCQLAATLCAGLLAATLAQAQVDEPFVVRDFRIEGAQRISEGTIYNYLPINIGDTIDTRVLREAGRALYSTGFFQDFEFRRDGDTLVIAVLERPTIQEFSFDGNKDIDDDQLEESLAGVGLAQGKIFDRSVLEDVTNFLTDEYYGRGKYGARITPTVESLPDNRVRVNIHIEEGARAKIQEINIVGNTAFDDKQLLEGFELSTGNMLSFIRDDDRYSKQALEGDIETLRSYYMDRGYADFRVDDAQVALSPDKKDVFVTITITEGDLYTISDVRLAGDMVIDESYLRALIVPQPGQIFSQQMVTFTEQNMVAALGADGYAFAEVRGIPDLDAESKQVSITFFVDPQSRVYVRRINFNGADNVNDEVFRREMRQMEGGYLSNPLVDRSQILLQRLPFVEKVDHETNPVPGSPDQVDVDFNVEEGLPGQFGGSLGYSGSQGLILGGNFIHSNFMGTGNRVALNLSGGKYYKVFSMDFTDAYRNIDGLSRQISFTFQDITQFTSVSSDFSTQTANAGMSWRYLTTEYQYVNFGFSLQQAEMVTSIYSSNQHRQWVTNNGRQLDLGSSPGVVGTNVRSLELDAGWGLDSLNRSLFPDLGGRLSVSLGATVPGSDVEYYIVSTNITKYIRLPGQWRFRVNSDIAYGHAYGNETTALPPFRNFFGGGPGTIRGFKESRLGPIDSLGNPYGGNMLVANQLELIVPTPAKLKAQVRFGLFYDFGNVFYTDGVKFYDKLGDPIEYNFAYDRLKHSVGIGVEWLAPLGFLRFSYAHPLNPDKATDRYFGDQTEEFQFSVGQAF